MGAAGWCPVTARASSKQVSDVQPVSQWLSSCTHQPQSTDCQSQLRAVTELASNVQPLSLTPNPDCQRRPRLQGLPHVQRAWAW